MSPGNRIRPGGNRADSKQTNCGGGPDQRVTRPGRNDAIIWPLSDGRRGLLARELTRRRLEVASAVRLPMGPGGFCVAPAGVDLAGAALLAGVNLYRWDPDNGATEPRIGVSGR